MINSRGEPAHPSRSRSEPEQIAVSISSQIIFFEVNGFCQFQTSNFLHSNFKWELAARLEQCLCRWRQCWRGAINFTNWLVSESHFELLQINYRYGIQVSILKQTMDYGVAETRAGICFLLHTQMTLSLFGQRGTKIKNPFHFSIRDMREKERESFQSFWHLHRECVKLINYCASHFIFSTRSNSSPYCKISLISLASLTTPNHERCNAPLVSFSATPCLSLVVVRIQDNDSTSPSSLDYWQQLRERHAAAATTTTTRPVQQQ